MWAAGFVSGNPGVILGFVLFFLSCGGVLATLTAQTPGISVNLCVVGVGAFDFQDRVRASREGLCPTLFGVLVRIGLAGLLGLRRAGLEDGGDWIRRNGGHDWLDPEFLVTLAKLKSKPIDDRGVHLADPTLRKIERQADFLHGHLFVVIENQDEALG